VNSEQHFAPIVRASPARLARTQWGAGRAVWDLDAAGREVIVDRIDVHGDQADELVAALLDITPGTRVWVRSRRYLLDDRPVQLAVSYLPADLVDGTPITQPNPGPGGTPARLAELGAAPVDHVEDVRGRPAEPAEADALGLGRGAYVFHIVRRALTSTGQPVEATFMVLDQAAYVLRYACRTD
jgi:GntR family transcriptional regulator